MAPFFMDQLYTPINMCMNFRKVKMDVQTWLTDQHLMKPGLQILEGKNLAQDIAMLRTWVKDWNTKTTVLCYDLKKSPVELTETLAQFSDIPVQYKEREDCRLIIIGNIESK